jgi:ABC-2 type transport system ATP-binding protein
VLELIDLHRRFDDVVALDGVWFEVAPGRIVGFVGRNGSGKTTTMRIAMGVLEADAGSVRWRGATVDGPARRRFGYMPEERGLYPKMRVLEQLVYLARLRGLSKEDGQRRGVELMETLQVMGRQRDRVEGLSLGNQQRVQLAAALVHDPDVLILDEPFSGLDPVGVDVLSEVLRRQARERGAPVVFSSHQLDLVERLCDEVVLIDRGRVVASGTIDGLRASRERELLHVEVATTDATWWSVLDGVREAERLDGGVVLELEPGVDPQRVLDLARAAGDVTHLSRVRPSLAELFREVIAE